MSVRVLLMAGSMERGGSEQQTLLLLQHLNRSRFQPELYLSRRCGDLLSQVPEDVVVHAFSDTEFAPRVNWPGRWHQRQVNHLRNVVTKRRIDVVYDRTFHMSLLAGSLSPRTRRVAVIVSPPDRDLPLNEPRFLVVKKRRLRRSYLLADRVIAVSDAVRDSAERYYRLPRHSVETIYSPVDMPKLQSLSEALLPQNVVSKSPEDSRTLDMACVGRMTREKGHDLLLRSLAKLRDTAGGACYAFRLWLAGDGPERPALESLASSLHLDARVHFLGQINNVAPLIRKCDVLVNPSRYEGLPNVVMEAFALETPVIATAAGGTGELVQDRVTGRLVEPESVDALVSAIGDFLTKPQQGGAWSVAALQRLSERFDLMRYMQCIESLLFDLSGSSNE